jgi:hypothetical protein
MVGGASLVIIMKKQAGSAGCATPLEEILKPTVPMGSPRTLISTTGAFRRSVKHAMLIMLLLLPERSVPIAMRDVLKHLAIALPVAVMIL